MMIAKFNFSYSWIPLLFILLYNSRTTLGLTNQSYVFNSSFWTVPIKHVCIHLHINDHECETDLLVLTVTKVMQKFQVDLPCNGPFYVEIYPPSAGNPCGGPCRALRRDKVFLGTDGIPCASVPRESVCRIPTTRCAAPKLSSTSPPPTVKPTPTIRPTPDVTKPHTTPVPYSYDSLTSVAVSVIVFVIAATIFIIIIVVIMRRYAALKKRRREKVKGPVDLGPLIRKPVNGAKVNRPAKAVDIGLLLRIPGDASHKPFLSHLPNEVQEQNGHLLGDASHKPFLSHLPNEVQEQNGHLLVEECGVPMLA